MSGSRQFHFKGFSIVMGDIRCDVNLDRFSAQFRRAQTELDIMVMNSMLPFIAFLTGDFARETRAESTVLAGSGRVIAGVPPRGRMLYEGKVMVDAATGKGPANIPGVGPRFHKGAKLKVTSRDLTYSNGRQSHWFEPAKAADGKVWVKKVKKIAGGG